MKKRCISNIHCISALPRRARAGPQYWCDYQLFHWHDWDKFTFHRHLVWVTILEFCWLTFLLSCNGLPPLISACLVLYGWPSSLWTKDPNIDIFKGLALPGRMASTPSGGRCKCLFLAECVIASSRHLPRACLLNNNIRGPQESSTWESPTGFFMCFWKGTCLTCSQVSTFLVEK